jgi:hypothetical protein
MSLRFDLPGQISGLSEHPWHKAHKLQSIVSGVAVGDLKLSP